MLDYDNLFFEKGYTAVCGLDEAGRGPVAGPVCAAAVILPRGIVLEGVNDSKKLSEKKRELLFDVIKENATAYAVAWASVEEIEKINILQATMLAMKRAVESLDIVPDYAIVDGNRTPDLSVPCSAVVKGDSLSQSVAAASILAKVSRDRLMMEYALKYPQYHFEKHKGYGTALHKKALRQYGLSPIHRESFVRTLLSK